MFTGLWITKEIWSMNCRNRTGCQHLHLTGIKKDMTDSKTNKRQAAQRQPAQPII